MTVRRDGWDENGLRSAECERCGMVWIEGRESVELFPGSWTLAGERPHECPEPLPYDHAAFMRNMYLLAGMPISQRMKARIELGLARGPSAE